MKAAGDAGSERVKDVCNAVLKEGRISKDWNKSWMVNIYNGKGNDLECGSYRGIKLFNYRKDIRFICTESL